MKNKEAEESFVFDKNGLRGKIVGYSTAATADKNALIELEGGIQVVIPMKKLAPRKPTGFKFTGTFEKWHKTNLPSKLHHIDANGEITHGDTISIPVIEEELEVKKRKVETGSVRINKTISEREEIVDQTLSIESVKVERIAINRIVEEAENSRYENNTWVIPVYEEVAVVEKRLFLREEIRITKEMSVEQHQERIPLRSEKVTVDKSN